RDRTLRPRHSEEDGGRRGGRAQGPGRRSGGATPQAEAGPDAGRRGGRRGGRAHAHSPRVIAQVSGRLAAKLADRVVVQTAGGVGYEIAVPLGVMEQLPPSRHWSGWDTAPPKRTARCATCSRRMAAAAPRRWCGAPCTFSLVDDDGDDRRMDLHAVRLDQPATRPGRREARGGRVPHLSHTPRPGGGPPAGSVARAAREQQAGGVSVIL